MSIRLGDRVRDRITGFEGVVIARLEYLNGCVQYCVKPKIKPDKPNEQPDGCYIDEKFLEVVPANPVPVTPEATGGDLPQGDRAPRA